MLSQAFAGQLLGATLWWLQQGSASLPTVADMCCLIFPLLLTCAAADLWGACISAGARVAHRQRLALQQVKLCAAATCNSRLGVHT
jgi:hypothetical protein